MPMRNESAAQTHPARRSSIRELREELDGPPRPSLRARVSAVGFTVLLVATLVAPAVLDVEAMPGTSLVALGMLLLLGFAELIDASSRRFVLAVRLGGIVIALLGFGIQVL